ncbi:MAG: HIT family protein [Patescibacteria group bacterium]|nr:MAG: HIT family protein [Patescibacteria group bacterium]
MTKVADCLFCKMIAGEVSYHKIYEDEKHLAFLTIFPNTKGATVVITKEHYGSSAFDQEDSVLKDLIVATKNTANILTRYFEDVGRCGMVFEGFGVDHLHSKLYPLHGTAIPEWKPIESGKKKDYYEMYPGYICSNDSQLADSQELAELAKNIRESQK